MNKYYSINETGSVDNIIIIDSEDSQVSFNDCVYFLDTLGVAIGQTPVENYYLVVKKSLDEKLSSTDFWELPMVQSQLSNVNELLEYRTIIRRLRISLTAQNYRDIYIDVPEKPSEEWIQF